MKKLFILILALIAMLSVFKENRSLEDAAQVLWDQAEQSGSCVAVLIGNTAEESYC